MDQRSFDSAFDDSSGEHSRNASLAARLVIILAGYQAWFLGRLRRSKDACAEAPTGAGKTLMIRSLVASDLGLPGGFSHAIVSAPQEQIERGFLGTSDMLVQWPQGVAAQTAISIPARLFRPARRDGCGTRRSIARYLGVSARAHALVCTHAALSILRDDDLPTDLTGRLLVIDEAHHAPAQGLSRIARLWQERGGRLLFFTATPYRNDGQAVVLPGMKLIRRSLAQHMEEGYAPETLASEIVALGRPSQKVTPSQFTGDTAPPGSYTATTTRAVVGKWIESGRPKTIVRVPPGRGRLVRRIVAAFERAGARVLDATGIEKERKRRFLTALDAERGRTFDTSEIDIIVGIQRVLEGTDWPHCSTVFAIGIPGSLQVVVQLVGRALRRKLDTYPEPYRYMARVVFFVPSAGGSALTQLSLDHSRHVLLVAAFMADHAVGQAWTVTAAVQRGVRSAMAGKPESAVDEGLDIANGNGDPVARAEAQLALVAAREDLVEAGQPVTAEALCREAVAARPDIPPEVIEQVTVELLASVPASTACDIEARLEREVEARVRVDPQVQAAMRESFAAVLSEFRETTLEKSPVLTMLRQQVHTLTGGAMRAFAARLAAAVPKPLGIHQVLAWADAHHADTGSWPSAISGDVRAVPGETWGAIDRALRLGARGLLAGGSLAQLLEEHRNAPNHLAPRRVTLAMISAWAKAHYRAHGSWPTRASGAIPGTPFTWCAINIALTRGLHGLKGGTSLPRYLERLGVRNIARLLPLTDELVAGWVQSFRAKNGAWPTENDGQIDGAPHGDTWMRVAASIAQGRRGITRRTSFAAFLHEVCGAPAPGSVRRELTIEFVMTMAVAYLARTGRWPNAASVDPQLEAAGETWHRIDRALRTGGRGLPKTTLLQLHARHLESLDGGKESA